MQCNEAVMIAGLSPSSNSAIEKRLSLFLRALTEWDGLNASASALAQARHYMSTNKNICRSKHA